MEKSEDPMVRRMRRRRRRIYYNRLSISRCYEVKRRRTRRRIFYSQSLKLDDKASTLLFRSESLCLLLLNPDEIYFSES